MKLSFACGCHRPSKSKQQRETTDPPIDATPEDLMISGEMLQGINRAINELPPQCRLVFKLVKEDGLKYREVAELLHLSLKTVENQMGIALKKIHSSILVYGPPKKFFK